MEDVSSFFLSLVVFFSHKFICNLYEIDMESHYSEVFLLLGFFCL